MDRTARRAIQATIYGARHGRSSKPPFLKTLCSSKMFRQLAMSLRFFSVITLILFLACDTLGKKLRNVEKADAPHPVFRRNGGTCEDYYKRFAELNCDADHIQAWRDASENKSCCTNINIEYVSDDLPDRRSCGSNRRGTVCAAFRAVGLEYDYTNYVLLYCSSSVGVECEEMCQQTLSQLAKEAGCCIHTFGSELIKEWSLWTNCGVEQPLPCDNTPPPLDKPTDNNYCSIQYSHIEMRYLLCSTVGEKLKQLNTECGVPEETYYECGHHNGKFCYYMDDPFVAILTASNKCNFSSKSSISGICPSKCKQELRNLKDTYGCCLNAFVHDYGASDSVLQTELWEMCGVDFPVECGIMSPPKEPECSNGSTSVLTEVLPLLYSLIYFTTALSVIGGST